MEKEKTEIIEYTMGVGMANLIAMFLIIPIGIVFILPFLMIWDSETFRSGEKEILGGIVLLVLLVGILVHELLHGISWGYYAKKKIKSIKFGIKWKYLTPYCHCKEPLKVKHYRIGAAMPLLVLGILPSIVAIILGNGDLLFFGVFFTWAAGGDIIALFMLSKLDGEVYISDHSDKMGFYREIKPEQTA